jgi:hypothetical protein
MKMIVLIIPALFIFYCTVTVILNYKSTIANKSATIEILEQQVAYWKQKAEEAAR